MKKSLAIALVVSTLAFFSPAPVHAAAPTDYVSCFDLDEVSTGAGAVTRIDANTTNSNDLTDTNTVASAAGKVGNAADFESTNSEYLTITDANQLGLDIATTMTVAYWVNFESDTDAVVIDKSAVGSMSYWLQNMIGATSTTQRFTNSAEVALDAGAVINTGTWYHIIWTYNAGTVNLYVNNVHRGSASNGTSLTNSTAPWTIGRVNKYTGNYVDGLVDIVEVYNRVITAGERTDIYNGGSGVGCTARSAAAVAVPPMFILFE